MSNDLASNSAADRNQQFQNYILANELIDLAQNVKITVLPSHEDVALGEVTSYEPAKEQLFYEGRDTTTLQRFASEQANLFHVSQTNPRRKLQLRFLKEIVKIQQVPDRLIVDRIPARELAFEEAMLLVRLRGVLLDDYLMPDIDAAFATISHGVAFHVEPKGGRLCISIARNMPAVGIVLECYRTAHEVFGGFVKDFVRAHLYPHISGHVPSSTNRAKTPCIAG